MFSKVNSIEFYIFPICILSLSYGKTYVISSESFLALDTILSDKLKLFTLFQNLVSELGALVNLVIPKQRRNTSSSCHKSDE
ncbi:MAG: hypothetical protein GY756_26010 [bacterium]|nr:hypothetical protein [bacterium]